MMAETGFSKADIKNNSVDILIKIRRLKMNTWIISAIVAGLLILAGVAVVSTVDAQPEAPSDTIIEASECTSCGNSCSLESNCGLASCGAVSGGSCGCGR